MQPETGPFSSHPAIADSGYYEGPPGKGGGGVGGFVGSIFPCSKKNFLVFPCSLKVFLRFWCSLFPKICFCSRVSSFIFLLFPCSLKINSHVPLLPKTPGRPSLRTAQTTVPTMSAKRELTVMLKDKSHE